MAGWCGSTTGAGPGRKRRGVVVSMTRPLVVVERLTPTVTENEGVLVFRPQHRAVGAIVAVFYEVHTTGAAEEPHQAEETTIVKIQDMFVSLLENGNAVEQADYIREKQV